MWLPIDTLYSVSDDGQVKRGNRILKGATDTLGYNQVFVNGKLQLRHRLIASRFLPAPTDDNCEIDHIDRNKSNNSASNLRWVSRSANMLNRTHYKSELTNEQYISIYYLKSGNIRYTVTLRQGRPDKYKKYFETLQEAIVARDKNI